MVCSKRIIGILQQVYVSNTKYNSRCVKSSSIHPGFISVQPTDCPQSDLILALPLHFFYYPNQDTFDAAHYARKSSLIVRAVFAV